MGALALILGVGGAIGLVPAVARAAPSETLATVGQPSPESVGPAWYDRAWPYRRTVQISHPGSGGTVDGYQVPIQLDASFDFAHTARKGNDIRFTARDGTTLIPFWIESWDAGAQAARIWVKVPTIPVGGTAVYLYYGNAAATPPTSTPVPVPPTGPWTKDAGNPQSVIGAPCGGSYPQLLPENMVASGGKYYLAVSDRSCDTGSVALLSANSPSGPWTYTARILTQSDLTAQGEPRNQIDAPHLLQVGSDWYLFYSHFYPSFGYWNDTDRPAPIGLAKSTDGILGPYTQINSTVLTTGPTGTWDDGRVSEPYVLQIANGDWVMVYMADASPQGGYTEQIGIATSTTGVEGPYVKSTNNPVLAFGPERSLDANTIADPWVVGLQGTYYIGYTASPTKSAWNTTYATTTDWETFTKSNQVILPQGDTYDSESAFRGAVTLVGNTYFFPYTSQDGTGYHFSMATQPATAPPLNIVNNADAVFNFYDGFSGSALDTSKWAASTRETAGGSVTVSGGHLTLTAPAIGGVNIQQLTGTAAFGPGGIRLEARARHTTAAGDGKTAGEVGFGTRTFDPSLRIVDYSDPLHFQWNVTNGTGGETWPQAAHPLDSTSYLIHKIGWAQPGAVTFALDNDSPETIATNIPTRPISPWLAAVALGEPATISVDWVRVRKWVGEDAQATIGKLQRRRQPSSITLGQLGPLDIR